MKNALLLFSMIYFPLASAADWPQITESGQVIRVIRSVVIPANTDQSYLTVQMRKSDPSKVESMCILYHDSKLFPRVLEEGVTLTFHRSWLTARSTFDTIKEVKLRYGVDLKVNTEKMTLADVDKAVTDQLGSLDYVFHLNNQVQIDVFFDKDERKRERTVCTSINPISEDQAIKMLVDSGFFSALY